LPIAANRRADPKSKQWTSTHVFPPFVFATLRAKSFSPFHVAMTWQCSRQESDDVSGVKGPHFFFFATHFFWRGAKRQASFFQQIQNQKMY